MTCGGRAPGPAAFAGALSDWEALPDAPHRLPRRILTIRSLLASGSPSEQGLALALRAWGSCPHGMGHSPPGPLCGVCTCKGHTGTGPPPPHKSPNTTPGPEGWDRLPKVTPQARDLGGPKSGWAT